MDTKLYFGKRKGKTLEWLFFNDPGYMGWMIKEGVAQDFSPKLRERFETLVQRASHLKLPGSCNSCHKMPITKMALNKHFQGGVSHVDFLCDSCKPTESKFYDSSNPTLLIVGIVKGYDKLSQKIVLDHIKRAYFSSTSHRLTQKRLESFFDDPNNFVNN